MDDNLDTLGLQTIHRLKKSSKKKASQQENKLSQNVAFQSGRKHSKQVTRHKSREQDTLVEI